MLTNNYGCKVVLANTEESKKIHYKLRYQIYCLDKGFLKLENPGKELERDLYDDKSVHFLIQSENSWIGTFRLVIDHLGGLPFYKVSAPDSPQFNHDKLKVAEFSRLGILRPFQKLNNTQPPHNSTHKESEIMLKVLYAARDYCHANGIHQIIFLCRRSIARILKQIEIQAQQIGPPIVHYGPRVPFAINLTDNHDKFDALVNKYSNTLNPYSLYSNTYHNNVSQIVAS